MWDFVEVSQRQIREVRGVAGPDVRICRDGREHCKCKAAARLQPGTSQGEWLFSAQITAGCNLKKILYAIVECGLSHDYFLFTQLKKNRWSDQRIINTCLKGPPLRYIPITVYHRGGLNSLRWMERLFFRKATAICSYRHGLHTFCSVLVDSAFNPLCWGRTLWLSYNINGAR